MWPSRIVTVHADLCMYIMSEYGPLFFNSAIALLSWGLLCTVACAAVHLYNFESYKKITIDACAAGMQRAQPRDLCPVLCMYVIDRTPQPVGRARACVRPRADRRGDPSMHGPVHAFNLIPHGDDSDQQYIIADINNAHCQCGGPWSLRNCGLFDSYIAGRPCGR